MFSVFRSMGFWFRQSGIVFVNGVIFFAFWISCQHKESFLFFRFSCCCSSYCCRLCRAVWRKKVVKNFMGKKNVKKSVRCEIMEINAMEKSCLVFDLFLVACVFRKWRVCSRNLRNTKVRAFGFICGGILAFFFLLRVRKCADSYYGFLKWEQVQRGILGRVWNIFIFSFFEVGFFFFRREICMLFLFLREIFFLCWYVLRKELVCFVEVLEVNKSGVNFFRRFF